TGPAAGVVGARAIAAECGIKDLITVDIGGTSADICLIKDGDIGLTQKGSIGEWPLPLPMVDMVTIGAGGGSIAALSDGPLTVGPSSAGAVPGPAAYGKGGTRPTVTDAHVALGHLPLKLLNGAMTLDAEAAETAITSHVSKPLGLGLHDAARGILAIANNHMVGAIRLVSVERGHDPRDFTLVPFGGAGPLHGCALAELLGMRRVMVPPAPGLLCADGLLVADLKSEFSQALPEAGPVDQAVGDEIVAALEQRAKAWLDGEAVPQELRERRAVVLLRFRGQGGEIAVPWSASSEATCEAFRVAHRALYGFVLNAPIEMVTLRVEAAGRTPSSDRPALRPAKAGEAQNQVVHFESGSCDTPIIDRATLGANATLEGPVIVTQLDATTVIPPGWSADVHASGAMILTRKDPAE
ncbi:MAG TPA: 5-oxoprolinase, partial [Sulfitobacter sp.]|nr:5-oxoprolinase [Sulfitobacter sp.]